MMHQVIKKIKGMDSKYIVIISISMLLLIMVVTTVLKCVSNRKITEREGYRVIRDIPGIEFQVNKEYCDYSTSILEISDNVNFSEYQTYLYKNGMDTYCLFNISGFIIIAKKGTCFDFNNMDVNESLSVNSLDGIWFSPMGKSPVRESSEKKYKISVLGQVVITSLVYNDFSGTLTTLTRDGEEWSVFAGVTTRATDECRESIEYTVKSITLQENQNIEDHMGNDLSTEENKLKLEAADMLNIGDSGIASVMNDNGGNYVDVQIRMDKVYSAEETRVLIDEYISSGNSYYQEMNAPEGTHFEAVSYSVKSDAYVNMVLCGMDGEDLRYRGIIYPHTTHDIANKVEETDGWHTGYICYYAVPDGCIEYVISCGPKKDRKDRHSVYFYVKSIK